MKKLLLVLLVPVLVLGLMVGCGVFDGDTTPIPLQGVWFPTTAENDLAFVVTANQITVFRTYDSTVLTNYDQFGNIAFRTSYTGDDPDYDTGAQTVPMGFEFYWFEGSNDLIGTIEGTIDINGANPNNDVLTVEKRTFEYNYQNVMIPPRGIYTRTGS